MPNHIDFSGHFLSPLRYPGGKRKLANFIKLVVHYNDLLDSEYFEPYAGGASVALALLFDEYVRHIHINDLDFGVYAFWHSALNSTEALCRLIHDTPVTMEEWYRQKHIQGDSNAELLKLGFSTFFLNRTNRSGIISGGVVGGKAQSGKWKLDARFNKLNLINRIQRVARYQNRIHLYNLDGSHFLNRIPIFKSDRVFVYLDPPYFVKGQQLLYKNYYQLKDHETVAKRVRDLRSSWIVSYDEVPEIRTLYKHFPHLSYGLQYSAQERYRGKEIMFFSKDLNIPDVINPAALTNRMLKKYLH